MSKTLLANIKMMYEELPVYLKKGVKEYAKNTIMFDDNSKIKAATTTKDAIRGQAITLLILDEFAFVPLHICEEFYTASQPALAAGNGKLIIISTPNGASGLFYDLYSKAPKNEFRPFRVEWNEIPGRDEAFRERTIKEVGATRWAQEYSCAFLGSSTTLISGKRLQEMYDDLLDPPKTLPNYKIWEEPLPNRFYVLGVDVALGVGKDRSVIQVIDITERKNYRQVACYVDDFIRPEQLVDKIQEIGIYYNKGYVIVENNSFGYSVCQSLWNVKMYENLYREPKKLDHGITAATRSKCGGVEILKMIVEEKWIKIRDKDTLIELNGFVEVKPRVYACEEGDNNHDDRVSALQWAAYFTGTAFWIDQESFLLGHYENSGQLTDSNEPTYDPPDMSKVYQNVNMDDEMNW